MMLLVVILVAVGTLLVAAIVFMVVRQGQKQAAVPSQTTCGKCGYPATGLKEMRCPECGADFREVGILTPMQRASWMPHVTLWLWILGSPIVICPASGVFVAIAPDTRVRTAMAEFSSPPSQVYDTVSARTTTRTLNLRGRERDDDNAFEITGRSLTFDRPGEPDVHLDIGDDAQPHRFSINGRVTEYQGETVAEAFVDWWEQEVGEVDRDALAEEVDHLVAMIDHLAAGGSAGVGGGPLRLRGQNFHTTSQPHLVFTTAAFILAIIVWVVGIVWIRRSQQKRLRTTSNHVSSPVA